MREPALVPRLRPFTSTIFAEMTALAVKHKAVNLGQGFPDTDGPDGMLEAAKNALFGGANQYPPGPGRPELRAAIARHRLRYGTEYDPDTEILVTAGATEAITATLIALTEAGDEVIVIEPYYDSYAAAVAMAGAQRRVAGLVEAEDGRFGLDVDALRAAVTPRTRAILVNSPHNPTGTVFTRAELEAVAALCVEHDLIAITDEVYEHLVFDDAEHIPLATYFVCVDVRPLGFTDAADLAWELPERVGVAAVPVKVFTDHPDEWKHLLRFAFCKRNEVIDEAITRLRELVR